MTIKKLKEQTHQLYLTEQAHQLYLKIKDIERSMKYETELKLRMHHLEQLAFKRYERRRKAYLKNSQFSLGTNMTW
ncbi:MULTISPECIES: hypothetical protein [Methylobacter]